ncbi:MAG: hypothetical protein WAX77_12090 [Methylococcaceae bacterium]
MKKFGIVGEGITDHITIENILCGFFDNIELDDEIVYLPLSGKGGWEIITDYLTSEDFRNDVLNHQFIIVNIDTDITTKEEDANKFGVYFRDENNNELSVNELIEQVKISLIKRIDSRQTNFYEQYKKSIIFAISVHQLECWLIVCHDQAKACIHDCYKTLQTIKLPQNVQPAKKYANYNKISQPFLDKNVIQTIEDPSFNHFIGQLQTITLN